MSKKTFKTSLKSEFDQKIPNVLSKIDLENIHIKEKETATSRFRRPVFRLVTAMSLAIVIIVAIVAISLNSGRVGPQPLVASREDEAMMASVISAYQLSNTTTTVNNSKITLSSDDDDNIDTDLNELFNEITGEINEFFSSIETLLFADDKADLERDDEDDDNSSFKLSAKSSHLSGWQCTYNVKYTITENEDGTKTVNGSLLIDKKEVSQFTGEVIKTQDKTTIIIYYGDIKIETWVENEGKDNEVTIHQISLPNKYGTTTVKEYKENDKRVIELIPAQKLFGNLYQKRYKFITGELNDKNTVEVIVNTESGMFQISSETRMIITATETAEYIEYTYDFKGNITILGITQHFEFTVPIRHRKD